MDEFARLYESRVNLPLELDAHPNAITEGKVRVLARLPIALLSMGIQSGSRETLWDLYHRPTGLDRIAEGFGQLLKSIFGSRNERVLRELGRDVDEVSSLEGRMKVLTDAQLAAKTTEFRELLDKGESLDDVLPGTLN